MSKKILLITILFAFGIQLYGKKVNFIQRLNPTFWWTDMKNPDLQLMFYGKKISDINFKVDYPGVTIKDKKLTDNPDYVFLYLHIAPNTSPGKVKIELDKDHKKQIIYYELKQRRPGSALRKSFTSADAIYLLMPDRFANGDTTNDSIKGYFQGVHRNIPGARHGGDIAGIISKIPYLANLGITTLWTTPLLENNDSIYSYHHYGCTNYYRVDPRFGTNNDYRRLSDSCHVHGLKLLIDVVPNHCSGAHWWLTDLPAKNWFHMWPKYTPTNYRVSTMTDPHASQADKYKFTHGWFATNMPDFNLDNKLVFDYLSQAYIFWIEYANIDGMRVDTYSYNDDTLAAKFVQRIRDEYPNMNVVGECWINSPAQIAYYQSGNNNKNGFDSRLTDVMDFCLKDAFFKAFNESEGWSTGMNRFYELFAQDFVYHNTNNIMDMIDNHDLTRFSCIVHRNVKKYEMGLAMLMTVRGFPQIYYGDEIMLDGKPGSYEGERFDFPGGWPDDKRNAFTASGRTPEENTIFNYTRTLLNYRKTHRVLQDGKMMQFIPENGIYVYFRYNEKDTIMVVVNNENENTLDLKRFDEMLHGKTMARDIVTNKTFPLTDYLKLPAKHVSILELK